MKRNILIINGHPNRESLSTALAESYRIGAFSNGHSCDTLNLVELQFDPVLKSDRSDTRNLEPDLFEAQEAISKADHLVFVFPIWWGTYPALLKGFIDRVFLSGFAFRHHENSTKWSKLLKGKTARIIATMDTPKWYYSMFYKNFGFRAMRQGLLEYCGVSPVKTTVFSPVHSSNLEKRTQWLVSVTNLGKQAA